MRSINLHLLGSNKEDAQQEVVWKEIGRRIWWNNVESDWIFINDPSLFGELSSGISGSAVVNWCGGNSAS
jgi:hypothetical protein